MSGKGQGYEREVCRDLSRWLTKGKREDLFWRSAMSGGRATMGRKRGIDLVSQSGDIAAVDPMGHVLTGTFFVEIKFYRDLDLHAFWYGQGKLSRFWRKAVEEAVHYGKQPMLIAKQNRTPAFVLFGRSCRLHTSALWWSDDASVGLFEDLLKQPFKIPAAVERWKPS